MSRLGPLLVCAFAFASTGANAPEGAAPPAAGPQEFAQATPADPPIPVAGYQEDAQATAAALPTSAAGDQDLAEATAAVLRTPAAGDQEGAQAPLAKPQRSAAAPTAVDVCRAVEQAAAENALPVEFFARVIWQESRFNAQAVSPKGAEGIAQFVPQTASWRGLSDPFDSIAALKASASYLNDLRNRFGNLGLAAAGYNAGPHRVDQWRSGQRALPAETRNYVAIITGRTVDEWASPSPPQTADTTIPRGVPCTQLANLVLPPRDTAQPVAPYVPRWGVPLAADLDESRAWAIYRERLKRFAELIADREPIVLHKQIPGMGSVKRYIITLADDDRAALDQFCKKMIAAGAICDVLRNPSAAD
jgi:soluble lytic murein transglycosylase-like protein